LDDPHGRTLACNSHGTRARSRDGLALWAAKEPAQDSRRQELGADVSYDLWRFSCEMPDAPHLSNN
jgi:hypothetical protein